MSLKKRLNQNKVLITLGVTQILSWGTLYYSIAVTSTSLQADLNLNEVTVIGAFSLGLLIAGAVAPRVGLKIDRVGGRLPFLFGSLFAAASFGVLATCSSAVTYFFGWILGGFAMALCLYDPAFSLLHKVMPERYRGSVVVLTLFGGFASTVFWPITHLLIEEVGWRNTYLIFAILHLTCAAPLHYFCLPGKPLARVRPKSHQKVQVSQNPEEGRVIRWLAISFASATAIFAFLSIFIIEALVRTGFTRAEAVTLAAMIGPLQVVGRLIEWRFVARLSAITTGAIALTMLLLSTVLLNVMPNVWTIAVIFIGLYGIANGIMTVARGAVPIELFDQIDAGVMLGKLARPVFITQACIPALFSALLSYGFSLKVALWVLVLFALTAVFFYFKICFRFYRRNLY